MICPLCGQSDPVTIRSKLRHDIQRNVLRCGRCSLVWLEPVDADLAEYYRSGYRAIHSPVIGKAIDARENFDIYLPSMHERLRQVQDSVSLGAESRALEIGCSTGHFLQVLKPLVKECVGVEINTEYAEFAAQRVGVDVYETLEESGRREGSFDVIFLFQVLEHLEDPVASVTSFAKYLTPGGTLYIEVPNITDALLDAYDVPATRTSTIVSHICSIFRSRRSCWP